MAKIMYNNKCYGSTEPQSATQIFIREKLAFSASNEKKLYDNILQFSNNLSQYDELELVYTIKTGVNSNGWQGVSVDGKTLERNFIIDNTSGDKFDGWYGNIFYLFLWLSIDKENNQIIIQGHQKTWVTEPTLIAIYGIRHIENENQFSIKDVYSTEEQIIGTWIDGEPIYRIVVPSIKDFDTTNKTIFSKKSAGSDIIKVKTKLTGSADAALTVETNTKEIDIPYTEPNGYEDDDISISYASPYWTITIKNSNAIVTGGIYKDEHVSTISWHFTNNIQYLIDAQNGNTIIEYIKNKR